MHTQKTSQSRLAFANLLAGATLSNYNHSLQKCKKFAISPCPCQLWMRTCWRCHSRRILRPPPPPYNNNNNISSCILLIGKYMHTGEGGGGGGRCLNVSR